MPAAPPAPEDTERSHPLRRNYWCFISYSHSDNREVGRQWANWLHQALETYDVPTDLIGTRNQSGEAIPERIFPVFRDEEELSVNSHLKTPIEQALERSQYLLVLCSPRSVASTYVAAEIRHFKQARGENEERVLAAIIAGDPAGPDVVGSDQADAVPYERRQCFPRPLRFDLSREGKEGEEPADPIAADFRLAEGTEGYTSPAAYRAYLNAKGGLRPVEVDAAVAEFGRRLELMKLKIIARILDVPIGVLTARDKAHQLALARRRARIMYGVAAGFALLAGLATYLGVVSEQRKKVAVLREQEARAALARSHYVKATELIESERFAEAGAYLVAAHRLQPDDPVCWALMSSLLTSPPPALPVGPPMIVGGAPEVRPKHSYDGATVIAQTFSSVSVFDVRSGAEIHRVGDRPDYWTGSFAPDGAGMVVTSKEGYGLDLYATVPGASKPEPFVRVGDVMSSIGLRSGNIALSRNMRAVMALKPVQDGNETGSAEIVWREKGFRFAIETDEPWEDILVASPASDLAATTSNGGKFTVWDLATGKAAFEGEVPQFVSALTFTRDGSRLLAATSDGEFRGYDLNQRKQVFLATPGNGRQVNELALSADDTAVAFAGQRHLGIANPGTGVSWVPELSMDADIKAMAFDAAGQSLLMGLQDQSLQLVDMLGEARNSRRLTHLPDLPMSVGFGPDGQTAVSFTGSGVGQKWLLSSDNLSRQLFSVGWNAVQVKWAPNGSGVFVLADHDGKVHHVFWIALGSGAPRVLRSDPIEGAEPEKLWCLSETTALLAGSDGEVMVVEREGNRLNVRAVSDSIEGISDEGGAWRANAGVLFVTREPSFSLETLGSLVPTNLASGFELKDAVEKPPTSCANSRRQAQAFRC
jgi:WD40 repeat protein